MVVVLPPQPGKDPVCQLSSDLTRVTQALRHMVGVMVLVVVMAAAAGTLHCMAVPAFGMCSQSLVGVGTTSWGLTASPIEKGSQRINALLA